MGHVSMYVTMVVENERRRTSRMSKVYQCLKADFDVVEKRIKSITKKLDKYGMSYHFKVLNSEVVSVPMYKMDHLTSTKNQSERCAC